MKNSNILGHYDYLIVGAGLYGVTCARLLTNKGFNCLVIDKREHIGGNCYTSKHNGIDIHEYGAHVFHTSNEEVWKFVNRYSKFTQYQLKVCATDGKKVYALPFNMFSFSQITGKNTPQEIYEMLQESDITEATNLEEVAIKDVGEDVYKKLVKGYTQKQWGTKCCNLSSDIIKRLPVRYEYDNNYFDDIYQGIPLDGYTSLVEHILDGVDCDGNHFEGEIDYLLGVDFNDSETDFYEIAENIIYCGSVDELLDYEYGELSWRSLRFEKVNYDYNGHNGQGCPLLNNTLAKTPHTRTIDHIYFNREKVNEYRGSTVLTYEYPEKWSKGKERFYPNGSNELYEKYVGLLNEKMPKVSLGGREGLYRYMNMDETISCAFDFCRDKEKIILNKERYNVASKFCKMWVIGTNEDDVKINGNYLYYNTFITRGEYMRQNINPLNRFLCEFVCMWYVWKNNLYSDYVGFCHYRRMVEIKDIDFTRLRGNIQHFHMQKFKKEYIGEYFDNGTDYPFISRRNNFNIPKFVIEDCFEYLNTQSIIPQDIIKDYCRYKDGEPFYYYNREIFCCEWTTFCELMAFVSGYVNFIANKYGLVTYDDWVKHISNKIISYYKKNGLECIENKRQHSKELIFQNREDYLRIYDKDEGLNSFCNNWRVYAYIIEDLVSVYIGTHKHFHTKTSE